MKYVCLDCGSNNVVEKELRKFLCYNCGEQGEYLWPIVGDETRSHFCPKCGAHTQDCSWKGN